MDEPFAKRLRMSADVLQVEVRGTVVASVSLASELPVWTSCIPEQLYIERLQRSLCSVHVLQLLRGDLNSRQADRVRRALEKVGVTMPTEASDSEVRDGCDALLALRNEPSNPPSASQSQGTSSEGQPAMSKNTVSLLVALHQPRCLHSQDRSQLTALPDSAAGCEQSL